MELMEEPELGVALEMSCREDVLKALQQRLEVAMQSRDNAAVNALVEQIIDQTAQISSIINSLGNSRFANSWNAADVTEIYTTDEIPNIVEDAASCSSCEENSSNMVDKDKENSSSFVSELILSDGEEGICSPIDANVDQLCRMDTQCILKDEEEQPNLLNDNTIFVEDMAITLQDGDIADAQYQMYPRLKLEAKPAPAPETEEEEYFTSSLCSWDFESLLNCLWTWDLRDLPKIQDPIETEIKRRIHGDACVDEYSMGLFEKLKLKLALRNLDDKNYFLVKRIYQPRNLYPVLLATSYSLRKIPHSITDSFDPWPLRIFLPKCGIIEAFEKFRFSNLKKSVVVQRKTAERFETIGKMLREKYGNYSPHSEPHLVFHGTTAEFGKSIAKEGLKVRGLFRRRNGAAHGTGIYCSPNLVTAQGYAAPDIFVCAVYPGPHADSSWIHPIIGSNQSGDIWVVRSSWQILPLYHLHN